MARRVVTLPPDVRGNDAVEFARLARTHRADLLEVRNDLHADDAVDLQALAAVIPVLCSERGRPLAQSWLDAAAHIDLPLESPDAQVVTAVVSHHAELPLSPGQALALWSRLRLPRESLIKHIEPLGQVEDAHRLFRTRALLWEHFGKRRVTVLPMGPLAMPWRAVLADENCLDYVALSPRFFAAPGQRLLDDAVRAARAAPGTPRLAILGSRIAGSRSPRIHQQPFDRLDLPEDAPIAAVLEAMEPFYRGFAVTSPFKKAAAQATRSPLPAVNTLVRKHGGYESANTDVEGALAVLVALGAREVRVLGDGGTTEALRIAAERSSVHLRVLKRAEIGAEPRSEPIHGAVVWTWPAHLEVPAGLRFEGARVAVIAYGAPAKSIAAEISRRGGVPLRLGARWFIAQAREQRRLWEEST